MNVDLKVVREYAKATGVSISGLDELGMVEVVLDGIISLYDKSVEELGGKDSPEFDEWKQENLDMLSWYQDTKGKFEEEVERVAKEKSKEEGTTSNKKKVAPKKEVVKKKVAPKKKEVVKKKAAPKKKEVVKKKTTPKKEVVEKKASSGKIKDLLKASKEAKARAAEKKAEKKTRGGGNKGEYGFREGSYAHEIAVHIASVGKTTVKEMIEHFDNPKLYMNNHPAFTKLEAAGFIKIEKPSRGEKVITFLKKKRAAKKK